MIRIAPLVLLAACYTPDTRDCTLACSAATDCAHGQVCSNDGFCAAPGTLCTSPDAAIAAVSLHVQIMGPGRVTIDGVGTCDSDSITHGDCTYRVTERVAQQLAAIATNDNHDFAEWTMACSGQSATCTIVPVSAMTQVGAKFQ